MAKIKNKKTKFKKSNLRNVDMNKFHKLGRQINREIFEAEYKKYEEEVEQLKIQKAREISQNVFQEIFIYLLGVPLLTLRNEGWGKRRLEYFFRQMMIIFKDYHEKRISSEDIAQAIKDETNFDLLAEKDSFIEWMKEMNLKESLFVYSDDEMDNIKEMAEKLKENHNEQKTSEKVRG